MNISRLIAPKIVTHNDEKLEIDTKAGTPHAKIRKVRIVRLNLLRLSLTNKAKKKPSNTCNVVATTVQTIVHVKTLINVSFHIPTFVNALKLSKPTQLNKLRGGALY